MLASSDYLAPHTCFPRTVRFLSCPSYRKRTLHGLAISVGGITESTTKAAGASLLTHVGSLSPSERTELSSDLVTLLSENASTPRVHLPLMRTAQHLLEARALEPILGLPIGGNGADETTTLASHLIDAIKPSSRSKDVPTLLVASSLLILLLPHATGKRAPDAWRTIVLLLAHRFPKVRKAAADQLYVHLLTYGDPGDLPPMATADATPNGTTAAATPEEEAAAVAAAAADAEAAAAAAASAMPSGDARLELLMSVLMETAWLDGLDANAKPARAKLLEALGLPPPKVMDAKPVAAKKVADEDSYKELVGEVGY